MQFLGETKVYHTVNNDLSVLRRKPCYCKISVLKVFLYSELSLFRKYLYMHIFVGFFCVYVVHIQTILSILLSGLSTV